MGQSMKGEDTVGVIDIDGLRARRQAMLQAKAESIAYAQQGISEFVVAAQQIGTPPWAFRGGEKTFNPQDVETGLFLVMRDGSGDEFWLQCLFGGVVAPSGRTYLRNKPSTPEAVAEWVAARCGYTTDRVKEAFEEALLGQPLG